MYCKRTIPAIDILIEGGRAFECGIHGLHITGSPGADVLIEFGRAHEHSIHALHGRHWRRGEERKEMGNWKKV
jgi:hypothetical protein